jgi:valyl-tRNA synthetase
LSTERLTANKAFTNKLWNAGKFVLQNLPSQTDVSAWEAIMDYKVSLSSLRGHRFFCCHVFYAYCRHCPVQLTEQILFFLQFDKEESVSRLPLPECWVVRK